ncbi:hypothetical protein EPUS_04791 [Endocarpon pusillum Z07020]|uniref:Uncharacterized protein n=1 Tax=Endocarpon pusillum (strain Z07020 / HMAS-L-300199) TaxID=1263415 RepID=U1GKL4_ENDPU|nr:uncharacterized protein EPUS_04791 [Endocarpon pusillum Z07020]ERF72738.1 hypothetical protein EPUS_04791 [Endocarpon pusillum Z07020]
MATPTSDQSPIRENVKAAPQTAFDTAAFDSSGPARTDNPVPPAENDYLNPTSRAIRHLAFCILYLSLFDHGTTSQWISTYLVPSAMDVTPSL